MESREVTLVTPPDLSCHRGLCSVPRLQAGALLIESGQPGEPATGLLVHLNLFTPVADRETGFELGNTVLFSPRSDP